MREGYEKSFAARSPCLYEMLPAMEDVVVLRKCRFRGCQGDVLMFSGGAGCSGGGIDGGGCSGGALGVLVSAVVVLW